jgi:selenocysteine lyase/cysteine desulfurase
MNCRREASAYPRARLQKRAPQPRAGGHGAGKPIIDGAIRLSFSRYSTLEEADLFADKLTEAAGRIFKTL